MEFEHKVDAWTVGQLRNALSGLPDDMPILVDVAEEPGGDAVQEQVVIHAGFGHGVDGRGEPFVGREFRIGCEFPSGTYLRRDR